MEEKRGRGGRRQGDGRFLPWDGGAGRGAPGRQGAARRARGRGRRRGRARPDRAVEPAGGGPLRLPRRGGPRPVRGPADRRRRPPRGGDAPLRRGARRRHGLVGHLPRAAQGRLHPAGGVPQHAAHRRPGRVLRPGDRRRPDRRRAGRGRAGPLRPARLPVPDRPRRLRHRAALRPGEPGPGADQRHPGRPAHRAADLRHAAGDRRAGGGGGAADGPGVGEPVLDHSTVGRTPRTRAATTSGRCPSTASKAARAGSWAWRPR